MVPESGAVYRFIISADESSLSANPFRQANHYKPDSSQIDVMADT
jgi:hypothetical protein